MSIIAGNLIIVEGLELRIIVYSWNKDSNQFTIKDEKKYTNQENKWIENKAAF